LFGTQPQSCTNTKCGALVGVEAIRSNYPSLTPCFKEKCDLRDEEITKALEFLQARSCQEVVQMRDMFTGFFVTLNRTMDAMPGLKVVAVAMSILVNAASGRRCAVGFQTEVTDITLEELLKAALRSEIVASQQAKTFLQNHVDLLQNDEIVAYLHQKMEDVCSARAAEELARTCGLHTFQRPVNQQKTAKLSLSSRRRSGLSLELSRGSASSKDKKIVSDDSCMSRLALDGYKVGPAIARSRLNFNGQVIRAQMGEELFAVKFVCDRDGQVAQALHNEYDILQKLTHPSIVKGFGLVVASDGCAMVMELVFGQMLSLSMPFLVRSESHGIASQLLSVFAYLHNQHRIAHRDLKGENVMISRQGNQTEVGELFTVKLIDFGSARKEDQEDQQSAFSSHCSSFHDGIDPRILPPGPGLGRGDAFEMDVFAIGLILVGLLQKHQMFTSDVFVGLDLRLALAQVAPLTEQYVQDILHPTGQERPKIEVAFRDLPPIEAWFTDHQWKPLEVAAEPASNVQSGRARPAIFMGSCLSCFPARNTKKDRG